MSKNVNVKSKESHANIINKLVSTQSIPWYGTNSTDEVQNKSLDDFFNQTIGDFGRWQFKISLLMSLLKLPIAWFQLGIVFLAPPTEFWCKQPEKYKHLPIDQWKQLITPLANDTKHHSTLFTGSCVMRDLRGKVSTLDFVPCLWGYDYNTTIIHSSIITEWDLVCGRERLVDVAQITLMFGVLLGSILFGIAADKFGRRKILLIAIFLQSFCGILSAFTPWFLLFLLLRFLLAMANGGTMTTSFVVCMEVVGGVWRTVVPILYQIPFGFGNSLMAGFAYFIRDWRYLQFTLSSLSGLFMFYYCLLPESPRWLLAVGRKEDAIKILEKAAAMNKMKVIDTPKLMNELKLCETISKSGEGASVFSLVKTPEIRKRTLLLCLTWLLCGISFFSFSQYLGVVSHNLYLAVAIGGVIAAPGTLLCVLVVKRCGRRASIACANIFTALCFLLILTVPKGYFNEDWPRITLAGFGVVGMSVSLPALYLFTGEHFPTVLRNAGIGSAVMCSKLGSMLAPLVISLGQLNWYLPLLVLVALSVLEGLLVLPLPETLDTVLPETVQDVERSRFSRNPRRNEYNLVSSIAAEKN